MVKERTISISSGGKDFSVRLGEDDEDEDDDAEVAMKMRGIRLVVVMLDIFELTTGMATVSSFTIYIFNQDNHLISVTSISLEDELASGWDGEGWAISFNLDTASV
ncbi:hypothetical protein QYF36_011095 [Acer negundo]|nr:hypothetical protein QYF36_011095 [Acer negundo]